VTTSILSLAPSLRGASRLPALPGVQTDIRGVELFALVSTGAAAALLSTFVDLNLGLPGHRILFSIFPMAMGIALVPRRAAGTTMGTSAILTIGVLGLAGARLLGVGGLTSLVLVGPLLDLALRWGRGGWRLYAAFIAAGAVSNAAAFAVRAGAKLLGFGGMGGGMGGGRSVAAWLPLSVWTYAAAGILAGLMSAAAWFHFRQCPDAPGIPGHGAATERR
jgi:hypothetical protein